MIPLAVRSRCVPDCDLLVSSSSAFVAGLRAPKGAKHVCYCHAPIRWAREGRTAYRFGPGGLLRGLMLDVAAPWFRWFDRRAGQQPDLVLPNSAHTANRIQTAWGRDAAVVYPDERFRELYRTATAFVQLHEEDFGITVVEALACGCPVMVHCTGGHSEIVTDGVGVQVDAENEDAIDDGFVRLLNTPGTPHRL